MKYLLVLFLIVVIVGGLYTANVLRSNMDAQKEIAKKEDIIKVKAVKFHRDYLENHHMKNGWALDDITVESGDINVKIDVTSQSQLELLKKAGYNRKVMIASEGCPAAKSDFWKIIAGENGKMRVWVILYNSMDHAQRFVIAGCRFPVSSSVG